MGINFDLFHSLLLVPNMSYVCEDTLRKRYKGECTPAIRLSLWMMLNCTVETMITWSRDRKIELKDWHTGNINFLDTAPPKFYLVDYDKNKDNSGLSDRKRMAGGVLSLHKNLTSKGVKEPWRWWVDETAKELKEWWSDLQQNEADRGDLPKLWARFTALERVISANEKRREETRERINNATTDAAEDVDPSQAPHCIAARLLRSLAPESAGSASIGESASESAPLAAESAESTKLATSRPNKMTSVQFVKKSPSQRDQVPAASEEEKIKFQLRQLTFQVRVRSESPDFEPDWAEENQEDTWTTLDLPHTLNPRGLESNEQGAGGGHRIEASEDLKDNKPKITGSAAMDWFQKVIVEQMQRMAKVDEEACHGRTKNPDNFRSRRQRMADPSLNAINKNGHDPLQIHRDRGQTHCAINNDMLRTLFDALLRQIKLTGWLEERMSQHVQSSEDANEFHSRQRKHFVKLAPDWKALSREEKAEALNEFIINKFSTCRRFWTTRKMQPTTGERTICQISWPGFYMTESEKEYLVQKVMQEYLQLEHSIYPNYRTA